MPESKMKVRSIHARRQILIIEDELINREILNSVFEESYEVLIAATAEEARR